MSIIDIMGSVVNGASLQFVPAQATVPGTESIATTAVVAGGMDFANAAGGAFFNFGDNLKLLNVWVNIPFALTRGNVLNGMGLRWRDNGGVNIVIPELANNSLLRIPIPGESALNFGSDGLYIQTPKVDSGNGRFKLNMDIFNLNVSMTNIHAALVGTTQQVRVYLEVLHTQALSVVP